MEGRILTYDKKEKKGTIAGSDGNRYSFEASSLKEKVNPAKDMRVDFQADENGKAKDIFVITDAQAETNKTLLGVAALALTLFFGVIGTAVTRFLIAKQGVKGLVPVLIHLIINISVIIPVIGWMVAIIGNIVFMVLNYKIAMAPATIAPKSSYVEI